MPSARLAQGLYCTMEIFDIPCTRSGSYIAPVMIYLNTAVFVYTPRRVPRVDKTALIVRSMVEYGESEGDTSNPPNVPRVL